MGKKRKPQGFAAMTAERHREICSKGGRSVPAALRGFTRNPALAASAGRKGGLKTQQQPKTTETEAGHGRLVEGA